MKRAKSLNVLSPINVTHVFDYASDDEIHAKQFKETLDLLKETSKLGKQIKYNLGYSNFTFELWIILHKTNCNTTFFHRKQYLEPINRAYGEKF